MSDSSVTVQVGSLADMGQRFVDAWHRAERGEAVDEAHVTFHDLPALLAALTPRRLALLRHVRHHPAASVRALAEALQRDYKNVHKDVDALARLGLLTRGAAGVAAPHGAVEARFVL